MLNTLATLALGAMMTAFTIFAVLLNEGEHSARLRKDKKREKLPGGDHGGQGRRHDATPIPSAHGLFGGADQASGPGGRADRRRLPVGDLLFGALFLRGGEPLAFAELARTAGDSGLDIAQVLTWVARAEEGGLLERVTDLPAAGRLSGHPAVRLTPAGMDLARNNRRGRGAHRGESSLDADRAFDSAS